MAIIDIETRELAFEGDGKVFIEVQALHSNLSLSGLEEPDRFIAIGMTFRDDTPDFYVSLEELRGVLRRAEELARERDCEVQ